MVSEARPLCASIPPQLQYEEGSPRNPTPSMPRPSITPTKKVELDRTIMPDGTIVTTVTTVQSRPRTVDGKSGKKEEPRAQRWRGVGALSGRSVEGQGGARKAPTPTTPVLHRIILIISVSLRLPFSPSFSLTGPSHVNPGPTHPQWGSGTLARPPP